MSCNLGMGAAPRASILYMLRNRLPLARPVPELGRRSVRGNAFQSANRERSMAILAPIKHIVVVMFENRSLDNMLGWLYPEGTIPSVIVPPRSALAFDGLVAGLSNPSDPSFFTGASSAAAPVARSATNSRVPNPDPMETFANASYQLFGPAAPSEDPRWPMQGFVVNYAATGTSTPGQIMEAYAPEQLPVLSQLAASFAVSDAWFSSVPSQTRPNPAFAHAGTSNGRVDNGHPPDPLKWNVPTIFNVLQSIGARWSVYSVLILTPSLTRNMFPKLWDPWLTPHFKQFTAFVDDCANDTLPRYSFIEPSFVLDPNDQHPPHDTIAGEAFLHAIWTAVSSSPGWSETLLVITYDEHGGCYDHVLPPFGAAPPDAASRPGDQGFGFDRFGVRVPAVLVSPWIAPGTVFRSTTGVPHDHTSILATLRDWLEIPPAVMLDSARIATAPTVEHVLTLSSPRRDIPTIEAPTLAPRVQPSLAEAPNDLQRSLVAGSARRFGMDPAEAVASIPTRQHVVEFFKRRSAHASA